MTSQVVKAAFVTIVALMAWQLGGSISAQTPAVRPNATIADIVRQASPATVAINTVDSSGEAFAGTGFIVDSSGTVVTNLHVIEGAVKITVRLPNGDSFDRVEVRGYDELKDLAIIQVPGFGLPTLQLGNSDGVQAGHPVVLIGNPAGLRGTVSSGIISAVRALEGYRVFQTDAAASPGSSGGPLLDSSGQAIGVMTFKNTKGESLNFVLPINYVRGLLQINDRLTLSQFNERLTTAPAGPGPAQAVASTPVPASLGASYRFRLLNERAAAVFAGNAVAVLQNAIAAGKGSSVTWNVEHPHTDGRLANYCRGTLSLADASLTFRSENSSEGFRVGVAQLADAVLATEWGAGGFTISIR